MRLSEAMLLGSTTCKMVPGEWNSCALGCAGNAVGIPTEENLPALVNRITPISDYWPWLRDIKQADVDWREEIWKKFDRQVCKGEMTLEQLVDYVRSIEPECGECCEFTCKCPKTAAVTEDEKVLVTL